MPGLKKILAYTDGASRGNPGEGAIGILLLDENRSKLKEHAECIGRTTNNKAEYTALIKALELAAEFTVKEVLCFCDSELVVRQAKEIYKIKNKQLKLLYKELKEKEKSFEKVSYDNLPRSGKNIRYVDRLLNRELDRKEKVTRQRL